MSKWGPGDAYRACDRSRARRQSSKLALALAELRDLCPCRMCPGEHLRDEITQRVGHHAGRVFRAREMAREAVGR